MVILINNRIIIIFLNFDPKTRRKRHLGTNYYYGEIMWIKQVIREN